jgi:hypothetical protein
MPWDPNKIPIWLRRTPAQQAADRAYQDLLRSAQGPGMRPNPTEQRLLRAAAVKRSASAQLEELQRDRNPNPAHIETAQAQLADALAMEGQYAEAAALHPKPEHAARFRKIAHAIDRPDDEPTCHCTGEAQTDPGTGETHVITGEHISEMVFSPKHGRMMPLVACARCGGMNVKPAPQHLEERIRAVRQQHTAARDKLRGSRTT